MSMITHPLTYMDKGKNAFVALCHLFLLRRFDEQSSAGFAQQESTKAARKVEKKLCVKVPEMAGKGGSEGGSFQLYVFFK